MWNATCCGREVNGWHGARSKLIKKIWKCLEQIGKKEKNGKGSWLENEQNDLNIAEDMEEKKYEQRCGYSS